MLSPEEQERLIRDVRVWANRNPYRDQYTISADTLRALLLAATERDFLKGNAA